MKLTLIAAAILSTSMLVACGGGGGGGGGGVDVGVAVTVPVTIPTQLADTTLVTSIPPTTYTPATESEEIAAFNFLNDERSRCGFGLVNQSTALDTAAKGHADWQIINNYSGHSQVAGTPSFTGVTFRDRMTAAGYTPITQGADEISTMVGTSVKTGFGVRSIKGLLSAPYHMSGLLTGFRDIGISVRNNIETGSTQGPRVLTQINLGTKSPAVNQLIAESEVKTYPCAGSIDINRLLNNETPNPVPGRDLSINPLGTSIYIAVRAGQTIAISNASMLNLSNASTVTLRTPVTSANDPNPGGYASHQAYVSADAPLPANTSFQVTVNGTNNGTMFSRTFQFSTGS
jgi:uncharacterized protein YkwD